MPHVAVVAAREGRYRRLVDGPLSGVRVLDFGRYIAGPYCAAILCDLGAEVIRVERVAGSEDRFISPVTDSGDGAIFLQCNRGKLGITLDPMTPKGREVTERLVASADVVVANLPDAALTAMGLDYANLSRVRADVILTKVTAFGTSGPYADRVGFDGIGQAMSGAMYLSGLPGAPSKSVVNYVDYATALSCALGTVVAVVERRRTGRGQVVEGSLLGSALTLMNPLLLEEGVLGLSRIGTGNRGQTVGPSDTFRTLDGFILVQVVGRPLFERWANLMGERHWLDDPRFESDEARGRNGEALSRRMAEWCAARTNGEALSELERAKIPAGPVYSPREVLTDPHVRAAAFFRELSHPGAARAIPVADTPFRLSETEVGPRGPAPALGEHTDSILGALGYSPDEIATLRRERVV
jgi:crotonobetainyl-CoA:carnitine CoA-transferase CaiB-like acyl-CoA transferase